MYVPFSTLPEKKRSYAMGEAPRRCAAGEEPFFDLVRYAAEKSVLPYCAYASGSSPRVQHSTPQIQGNAAAREAFAHHFGLPGRGAESAETLYRFLKNKNKISIMSILGRNLSLFADF